MIFCRRFRACSGLGSPLFVVMVRRMCGFTSPSRSASRVRPLGAGLLPGSPPWGVSRRALRQAGPFAGLSAGACVPGPALRRRPLAGSPPWGVSRRVLRQAGPFGGSFGRNVCPGPALRRRPFAGVSAVGRVSPRTPAGGTLRGSFRRNDLSKQGRPHKADGLRNVACRVICVSLPPARSLRRYRLCGCR